MENSNLSREDWLRAARLALLKGGPAAVRIEKIARDLKITKGSFYWHFKDREELFEALLHEWEEEKSLLVNVISKNNLAEAMSSLFNELQQRVILSERGEWPSDAAIFAWASVSPKVAKRVNKEEQRRIELLKQLIGVPELAEYIYMAYLGFILRRRRVPAAVKNFPILANISTELALSSQPKVNTRKAKSKVYSES
ncbi:MAG: TetR/AcrR family transcriptional regulator [Acidobacteriota bacterium]